MIINATGSKGGGSTPVINPLSATENGTYTAPSGVDGYSPVTVNVSGGGGGSVEESDVNFYDYDGTCVASYTATDFANLTAMPSNPSHTGLTAQGWNWSLSDAKTYVAKYGMLDIGQMYITNDGKTRLYCHFEEGRLHPYVGLGVNGAVEIDWGDESGVSTINGTSLTTVAYNNHIYATAGDYIITINVLSGNARIFGTTNSSHLLKPGVNSGQYYVNAYMGTIKKIEFGNGIKVGDHAFFWSANLEYLTIPSGMESFESSAFENCRKLKAIIFPKGSNFTEIPKRCFYSDYLVSVISVPTNVTDIGQYALGTCYGIKRLTLPENISTIDTYAFYFATSISEIPKGLFNNVRIVSDYTFTSCFSMQKAVVPDRVTQIGGSAFYNCYALTSLTLPASVTSIGGNAFMGCYGMGALHLKPTSPPTLGASAFTNVPTDCKIYVPYSADHSILEAYQTATNWSAQASKMVEEEP